MVTRRVFICLVQVNAYRGLSRYPRRCSTTASGFCQTLLFHLCDSACNGQIGTFIASMKDEDLLNGWKAIAAHLKISEKQARRWEKYDNLPIIRPQKRRRGPVFADKRALDAWIQGPLARTTLDDRSLLAFDKSDRLLWSYEFPGSLRRFTADELAWRIQRADLQGDGDRGLLVTVRFAIGDKPDTIYYFSPDGILKWKLEADPQLFDRDKKPFEKAWAFRHVIVTPTSAGSDLWVALANEAGWAGCVLRVNSRGKAAVHFANAGYVECLCSVTLEGEQYLVVCGENNDFDQSFVALLGTKDPPSSAPPGPRPRYRYANAPSGQPRKYVLFPRTELIVARDKPYGHAWKMRHYSEHIIVEVETGGDGAYFLFHFSELLKPKYVFPSGGQEFRHRDLEIAGKIDHPWLDCPELDQPLMLKTWEPTVGWRDEAVRWRDNPWKEK